MKILNFAWLIALGLLINSCKKVEADNSKEFISDKNVSALELQAGRAAQPDCPPGTHPVLIYNFGDFHFHRPIKDCLSGFWFCTIGGQWSVECVTNSPVAHKNGNSAFVWAEELNETQITIHFPLELKSTAGYSSADLEKFNVDEEYEIYPGVTLKVGEYPVKETSNELVVAVDIL